MVWADHSEIPDAALPGRLIDCCKSRYGGKSHKGVGTMAPHCSRHFATQPARQGLRASASYWSTRNRPPPAAPTSLDHVSGLVEIKPMRIRQINLAEERHSGRTAAEMGSDPNSAKHSVIRYRSIPELGSDPISAGHTNGANHQNGASRHRQPASPFKANPGTP